MAFRFKPSTPRSERGLAYRAGWWIGRLIIYFLVVSIGLTVIYKFVPPPVTLTMLMDPHGFNKDWTVLSRIDRDMVAAVIAGEDAKFCTHNGFDRAAIEKAMARNADGGKLRGGSTISQQTAKNVFLWQGTGWTRYVRKGLETWFTLLIENIWGKRRIMEVYLNVAETGIGTYGAPATRGGYPRTPNPDGWDVNHYLAHTPELFAAARERFGPELNPSIVYWLDAADWPAARAAALA